MLVADLLHSCANDYVAEAAVSSIGGMFKERMRAEASRRGVSVGVLAASVVKDFARVATEREWRDLSRATRGHDFPVLAGLEAILSRPSLRFQDVQRVASTRMAEGRASAIPSACLAHACG